MAGVENACCLHPVFFVETLELSDSLIRMLRRRILSCCVVSVVKSHATGSWVHLAFSRPKEVEPIDHRIALDDRNNTLSLKHGIRAATNN